MQNHVEAKSITCENISKISKLYIQYLNLPNVGFINLHLYLTLSMIKGYKGFNQRSKQSHHPKWHKGNFNDGWPWDDIAFHWRLWVARIYWVSHHHWILLLHGLANFLECIKYDSPKLHQNHSAWLSHLEIVQGLLRRLAPHEKVTPGGIFF